MPQTKKDITIGEINVTVRELTVADIFEKLSAAGSSPKHITDDIQDLLAKSTGLTFDDLASMYPSEIKRLWEAVRDVNAAFFEGAETMGLGYLIREIKNQVLWGLALSNPIFGELSADLSAEATTNDPSGDTAGPIS
jgi:hypothetical protein